jgi:hypothetical protein
MIATIVGVCTGLGVLRYDPARERWVGVIIMSPGRIELEVYCAALAPGGPYAWRLAVAGCVNQSNFILSGPCDPFLLQSPPFVISEDCCGVAGTVEIYVTL